MDVAWVKGKDRIGAGKSGSDFLTKMKNFLGISPPDLKIVSSYLRVCFPRLSSWSAQHGAASSPPVLCFSF